MTDSARENDDVESHPTPRGRADAKDTTEGSWVTGTGDEESDPLRDEAAERAAQASKPGRDRE